MKYFSLIILVLLANCKVNALTQTHGISNLKEKSTSLQINLTNQNDISNLFGPPFIIDSFDKNTWSYFEIKKSKNIFGKNKIILYDVVILKFNNVGVLVNYNTLDIKDLNILEISKNETNTYILKDTLIKGFLSSTKKRMDMVKDKIKINEQ